jgi:hypothetical protein
MEKIFPLFVTGVIDTCGKFTAVVVDNGSSLPPVSPLVHLGLRISPRIFEKIINDPHVISGTWGKMMHEKTPEAKYLVTLSL